ncbi:MAG: hypothetical protein ACOYW3_02295 [Bacteroidota bacterium]
MFYFFRQLLSQPSQILFGGSEVEWSTVPSVRDLKEMVKLIASTFISEGSLWLYLDNQLIMQNSDSVTVELEEGQEYIVHWFVKGTPGSSYSITISSPKEAQYQLTRCIPRSKKDFGTYSFKP